MTFLLQGIFALLINLASNECSAAIRDTRERRFRKTIEREEELRKALASLRSIGDEVRAACVELTRNRRQFAVTPKEEPLWQLLSDDCFQSDLSEWLMAGAIEEGYAAKDRLLRAMEAALANVGASPEQSAFLKTSYFDALEKVVFANPVLANWRHQLSLNYLREQVAILRQRAEEAAGVFSSEKQKAALDRYCDTALKSWDIIDLSNLPEGDIHMATQKLYLRRLYMPLRIEVEPRRKNEGDDDALARLEKKRQVRRQREAGHFAEHEPQGTGGRDAREPVGLRLAISQRLVVLGDPGGGKTTMLRWMATAYLLRHKGDPTFAEVPDTHTLPAKPWIPVLIRCRDLGEADLCRSFVEFLTQHLNKSELLPDEAEVMRAVILDRVARGEALLLVDGLDEITNPRVRMMFCQELERTAARYPDAPIVVTSRIVGYRDMPYRMGSGFEHGQIAELSRDDKDLFANRWVEVTEQHQTKEEKARRARELLDALHSNDRVERLTGNPMLLTTLALVKRKVGKLPNRRTKLYAEAVSVLLNWNPRYYQVIEEDEAIPQLEYLAYEMCRRGVQRLSDDDVHELLDKLRAEYPNIRAIKRREAHEFLRHLEERSSILIKSGTIWQRDKDQEKPVWEFRHLTFQEYLAARALLDGRYPGRDKNLSLAEQVAPLAGAVKQFTSHWEIDVPESWRETLRLLVAECNDDDVDNVLQAILTPMPNEDASLTTRPRAVLAALCLADEPNASEARAQHILSAFAAAIADEDGIAPAPTTLDRAAIEIESSIWSSSLKKVLIQEFCRRSPLDRPSVGGLWGAVEVASWERSATDAHPCFLALCRRLRSGDRVEVISAALAVMEAAYERKAVVVESLIASLLDALAGTDAPARNASAWALGWLCERPSGSAEGAVPYWKANKTELASIIDALGKTDSAEHDTVRWLATILRPTGETGAIPFLVRQLSVPDADARNAVVNTLVQLGGKKAVKPLLAKLNDPDTTVRQAAVMALGQLGDRQAVPPLLEKLNDPDTSVRQAAVMALGQLGDKQAVPPLLEKLNDPDTSVRQAAVMVLGQLGDKQAVSPLLEKLNDPDTSVRQAAVMVLGQLGDKQAVPPLLEKLNDPDTSLRQAAIVALGQLGDKQAVPPLLEKLNDPDDDVRRAAIGVLEHLGDKQVVLPLLEKLNDSNGVVRAAAIGALAKLGDKRAVSPLLAKLADHDMANRASAAAALHALGEARGTNALKLLLASPDVELRTSAVGAYARHKEFLDRRLLSSDIDASLPWLDPQDRITESQIAYAARRLRLTTAEVRARYETMAPDLGLKFS